MPTNPIMNENFNIIYKDENLLVVDKPAGIVVFQEGKEKTLIDLILETFPEIKRVGSAPRYGIVHRLDKDTSGLVLVAKNNTSLEFLQEQFKNRKVEKRYIALVVGVIKENRGTIETLIGRNPSDRRKQKAFGLNEPSTGKRRAETHFSVKDRFDGYTLVEVLPKTGRKHQIRAHFAHIGHPLAGDKLYSFKNQPCPKELERHFLHASYLKILLPDGEAKEFKSELPEDLKTVINNLIE